MRVKQDTRNMDVGQESSVIIPSTGQLNPEDFHEDFEIIENIKQSKLEALAFMEEMIDVVIPETDDERADPLPMVSINGSAQYFIRGMVQSVRRKFVEQLARSKVGVISTPKIRNPDGTEAYALDRSRKALRFNFQVVRDPNPKGGEWLSNVLKSAV